MHVYCAMSEVVDAWLTKRNYLFPLKGLNSTELFIISFCEYVKIVEKQKLN